MHAHIYSIDMRADGPFGSLEGERHALENAGKWDNAFLHQHLGKSAEIASTWDALELPKIDLLFIDGDHSLEGITTDFSMWSKFLNPNGMIAIHDYDKARAFKDRDDPKDWPAVTEFVNGVFENGFENMKFEFAHVADSLIVLKWID